MHRVGQRMPCDLREGCNIATPPDVPLHKVKAVWSGENAPASCKPPRQPPAAARQQDLRASQPFGKEEASGQPPQARHATGHERASFQRLHLWSGPKSRRGATQELGQTGDRALVMDRLGIMSLLLCIPPVEWSPCIQAGDAGAQGRGLPCRLRHLMGLVAGHHEEGQGGEGHLSGLARHGGREALYTGYGGLQ